MTENPLFHQTTLVFKLEKFTYLNFEIEGHKYYSICDTFFVFAVFDNNISWQKIVMIFLRTTPADAEN